MDLKDLTITDHAWSRYIERFLKVESHTTKIKRMIMEGIRIYPKKNRLKELLKHNFRNAEFYYHNGTVIVIVDKNVVVTMYKKQIRSIPQNKAQQKQWKSKKRPAILNGDRVDE